MPRSDQSTDDGTDGDARGELLRPFAIHHDDFSSAMKSIICEATAINGTHSIVSTARRENNGTTGWNSHQTNRHRALLHNM